MSTDEYRAGIVGTGFMGRVHAQAIRAAGGRIVGLVGSRPGGGAEHAAAFGAERGVDDLDALLAREDVDVVHICTPNHLHASMARQVIAQGRHVVCEKPLATTLEDAVEVTAAADDKGVVATVPFVYRFHPMVREARHRVASGAVGRLSLAHGSYLQDWLLRPEDDNWRVDPRLGGRTRAFADIGSHWCDLLEFVSGDRITAVSAQLTTVNDRRGGPKVTTEDVVTMQFTTAGGIVGTTVISQVSAGRKNRLLLEISGSHETVSFDQEQPETLWLGSRERSSVLVRDPATLSADAARLAVLPAGHPQGYQDCFNSFARDTRAAIGGDAPDGLPRFADGLRAARITEAVLESAVSRSWVEVPR